MPRIKPVDPATASGKTKTLFEGIQAKIGMIPNLYRTVGNSPAALEALLNLRSGLSNGALGPKLGERIALTVGEANGCDYCLAAHTAIGRMLGLDDRDLRDSRQATSTDPKIQAALRFAQTLVRNRGHVASSELEGLRNYGWGEGEIVEIIGNVALGTFTNYFNHVADPEIDFPIAEKTAAA